MYHNILVVFYIISRLIQLVEFYLNMHNTIKRKKNWHMNVVCNTYLTHQSNSPDILIIYRISSRENYTIECLTPHPKF